MRYLWSMLALLWTFTASATSVVPMPLEQIVAESDVVVVATVRAVDMVDARGKPITDPSARTGPGLKNQMRFQLDVHEVLFSRQGEVPRRVTVPLWQMWHYELGEMQRLAAGGKSIFLLKGANYEPAYVSSFERPLEERAEILAMLER